MRRFFHDDLLLQLQHFLHKDALSSGFGPESGLTLVQSGAERERKRLRVRGQYSAAATLCSQV